MSNDGFKCMTCKQFKPTSEYNKNITYKRGYAYECKECRKIRRIKILESTKEYNLKYHKEHNSISNVRSRLLGAEWRAKQYNVNINNLSAFDLLATLTAQDFKCYYCSKQLDKHFHIDHKIPLVKKGNNNKENIVASCQFCNNSKSVNQYPKSYKEQKQ